MKQPIEVEVKVGQPRRRRNHKPISANVKKGVVTTIIGSVLIIAATVSVFTVDAINWMDASVGILLGLGLIFAPDTIVSNIRNFLNRFS